MPFSCARDRACLIVAESSLPVALSFAEGRVFPKKSVERLTIRAMRKSTTVNSIKVKPEDCVECRVSSVEVSILLLSTSASISYFSYLANQLINLLTCPDQTGRSVMLKIAISIETTIKPIISPMVRIIRGSSRLRKRFNASRKLFS